MLGASCHSLRPHSEGFSMAATFAVPLQSSRCGTLGRWRWENVSVASRHLRENTLFFSKHNIPHTNMPISPPEPLLQLSPHSRTVGWFRPRGSCVEFPRSPCVCLGFSQLLQPPPSGTTSGTMWLSNFSNWMLLDQTLGQGLEWG